LDFYLIPACLNNFFARPFPASEDFITKVNYFLLFYMIKTQFSSFHPAVPASGLFE
jgi:hypothetical protein